MEALDDFRTGGELLALVWHKCGEAGLRELLTKANAQNFFTKESLKEDIAELEKAGLNTAAKIVEGYITTAPGKDELFVCQHPHKRMNWSDVPEHCPMLEQWGKCNCLGNRASMQRTSRKLGLFN